MASVAFQQNASKTRAFGIGLRAPPAVKFDGWRVRKRPAQRRLAESLVVASPARSRHFACRDSVRTLRLQRSVPHDASAQSVRIRAVHERCSEKELRK